MITVTAKAKEKIIEYLTQSGEAKSCLRLFVEAGGCSGFQYGLSLDEQRDGDLITDCETFKVVVDAASLTYLENAEVDYVEALSGGGFEISNPAAKSTCGCGKSFQA